MTALLRNPATLGILCVVAAGVTFSTADMMIKALSDGIRCIRSCSRAPASP